MSRANIKAVAKGCILGEGPHWDAERQELLYVDMIESHAFRRYKPSTGEDFIFPIDDGASVIVPVEGQANKYVVTSGPSIRKLEWDGLSRQDVTAVSSLPEIVNVADAFPGVRFNDGKCDALGRLWAGTMGAGKSLDDFPLEKGSLYKLGLDGKLTSHLDKISIANGLAWSSDNTKFFYVDSLAYTVQAFDFDLSNGTLSNRQVLLDFKKSDTAGLPDGMAIDTSNNLWVASFGAAAVFHVDSTTGKVIDKISFEGRSSSITSVAFGGPNLDVLYVTSGSFGVSEEQRASQPEAGALFEVTNIGAKGVSGGISYKGKLD